MIEPSASLAHTASWVIVRMATGEPVLETFDARVAAAINRERYRAVPILEYLQTINRSARTCESPTTT